MDKLYIIHDGVLVGYTYTRYAKHHEHQLLSSTVYVNKYTNLAVPEYPGDSNIDDWLLVDDAWDSTKIASESGWVDRDFTTKPKSYDVPTWAAKAALDEAGLLDAINSAIDQYKADSSTDNILYHKWYNATTFNSDDPDLKTFAANNGIEDKLNSLFEKALDISNKRGAYAKT